MGATFLDEVARKNEEGNRLFAEGKFEEALKRYRDAQLQNPEAPQLHFNAGDALYKQDTYDGAIQEFGRVLNSGDPTLLAKAYYNIGNAHFRQNRPQEAIGAYKKALELKPDDLDTKINLELAQRLLDEQQQDQQDQQDQDQQGEDQKQGDQEQQQQDQQGEDQKQGDQEQQQQDQQDQQDQQGEDQSEDHREGEMTREEAERLLEALKDREREAQKRRRLRLLGRRYTGNEW